MATSSAPNNSSLPHSNRLEVRPHTPKQPHQFHIPGGLSFQAATGPDSLKITIKAKLEPIRPMIRRTARAGWLDVSETQGIQIQSLRLSLDEPGGDSGHT